MSMNPEISELRQRLDDLVSQVQFMQRQQLLQTGQGGMQGAGGMFGDGGSGDGNASQKDKSLEITQQHINQLLPPDIFNENQIQLTRITGPETWLDQTCSGTAIVDFVSGINCATSGTPNKMLYMSATQCVSVEVVDTTATRRVAIPNPVRLVSVVNDGGTNGGVTSGGGATFASFTYKIAPYNTSDYFAFGQDVHWACPRFPGPVTSGTNGLMMHMGQSEWALCSVNEFPTDVQTDCDGS